MINYLEYLNIPAQIALAIVGLFFILQIFGELLEFKGKVVPEIMKVRKFFVRKRQEKKMTQDFFETLKEVKETIAEFNSHYNTDNIKMRDEWIKGVNETLAQNDIWMKEFDKKMDKNNADTLSLLIESKRNAIINFASFVIEEKNPVTREQFNRIFKLYREYEELITSNGMTNGEVVIAYQIITEAYEVHMRHHSFVEDIRGYSGSSLGENQ